MGLPPRGVALHADGSSDARASHVRSGHVLDIGATTGVATARCMGYPIPASVVRV